MNSGNWDSFKHSDPVSSLTDNECNDGSVSFSYMSIFTMIQRNTKFCFVA